MENVECSHTFENIENFLEHRTSFVYAIDSKTVEKEAAVCTVHHKKFKMATFIIKSLFKIFLFLIHKCFFIKFYTVSNEFYKVCVI